MPGKNEEEEEGGGEGCVTEMGRESSQREIEGKNELWEKNFFPFLLSSFF